MASPWIFNNVIANNNKYGLRTVANAWNDDANPQIINNTLANNVQVGILSAEGVYTGSFKIYNNLLVGHDIAIRAQGQALPRLECNGFWENDTNFDSYPAAYGIITTSNPNGDPTDKYFNLFLDPEFIDSGNGNYHLNRNSPAINAGCTTDIPLKDIDDDLRPQQDLYDMGVDEYRQILAQIKLEANPSTLLIGEFSQIKAQLLDTDDIPVRNQQVIFTTNLGRFDHLMPSMITDANGVVTTTLTSTTFGTATIRATAELLFAETQVAFERQPIPSPIDLTVTVQSASQLHLNWQSITQGAVAFFIERLRDGETDWKVLTERPLESSEYIDTNLTCGTTYFYRVQTRSAVDGQLSEYSKVTSATTLLCQPSVRSLDAASATQVVVVWQWEGETGLNMRIERSHDESDDWQEIAIVPSESNSYLDIDPGCGAFSYRLRLHRQHDNQFSEYSTTHHIQLCSIYLPVATR
ncbi:MAG: Ig-like domain-containing protein [Caldilineaceae bacterium]